VGVGQACFQNHHYLTAHNSYVLVLAELGLIGMVIWSSILALSVMIPVQVMRDFAGRPEAEAARTWAMGLLAMMIAMLVGIFFLSFSYKQVLWISLGLTGALYSAVRRHAPDWKVSLGAGAIALIAAFDVVLATALFLYSKHKGGA
jgi:hypothetical protein